MCRMLLDTDRPPHRQIDKLAARITVLLARSVHHRQDDQGPGQGPDTRPTGLPNASTRSPASARAPHRSSSPRSAWTSGSSQLPDTWCPGRNSPRAPCSPGTRTHTGPPARATPGSAAPSARPRLRRPHRHLPRRPLPPHRQTPRPHESPRRGRPLHPGLRLAPDQRPRPPATANSAPTHTRTPTPNARPATWSANSRPSATTSPSPRQPPESPPAPHHVEPPGRYRRRAISPYPSDR